MITVFDGSSSGAIDVCLCPLAMSTADVVDAEKRRRGTNITTTTLCSSNVVRCCVCGGIVDESGKNGSSAHMAALAYSS